MQLFGVSVSGFLRRKDKVLLIRRAKSNHFLPGYFELPGGKMLHDETPRIALLREYQEETGLKVTVVSPYATFSYYYDNLEFGRIKVVDIQYYVRHGHPEEIILSDEHDDYSWSANTDLHKYKISPESLAVIKKGFEK